MAGAGAATLRRRSRRRLSSRNSSTTVPRHTALARGRSSGGSGCRRSGSTSARNERRLLGSSGYGCCRRGGLSSSTLAGTAALATMASRRATRSANAQSLNQPRDVPDAYRQSRAPGARRSRPSSPVRHRRAPSARGPGGRQDARQRQRPRQQAPRLLGAALKQLGTGAGNAGHIHVAHMRHQVARQLKQVIALLDLCANKP